MNNSYNEAHVLYDFQEERCNDPIDRTRMSRGLGGGEEIKEENRSGKLCNVGFTWLTKRGKKKETLMSRFVNSTGTKFMSWLIHLTMTQILKLYFCKLFRI